MKTIDEQKIYQELAARHGWPESKYLPMIIKKMATIKQSEIMLLLPMTSEDIAEKLDMDKNEIDKELEELFEKGLVFPSKKGWRIGRQVDSLHDLTLSNKKYWDSYGGTQIADLWNAFERLEWWPIFVDNFREADTKLFRVMPAWEAVKDNPDFLSFEDIEKVYKDAETIVVLPCPCRQENYDKDGRVPDEICISLNRSAQYNLKRGVGRKITCEEAMALEKESRKHNFITHVPNNAVTNMVVCHCHPSSCLLFLAYEQYDSIVEAASRSRYEANVPDPLLCTGCQTCVEMCHFQAIDMKKYPGMRKWKAYVNSENCVGCGNCVAKCPKEGAIVLKLVRPPEHIPKDDLDIYSYENKKK
jgi:electron transport complex protein RnfB